MRIIKQDKIRLPEKVVELKIVGSWKNILQVVVQCSVLCSSVGISSGPKSEMGFG